MNGELAILGAWRKSSVAVAYNILFNHGSPGASRVGCMVDKHLPHYRNQNRYPVAQEDSTVTMTLQPTWTMIDYQRAIRELW